VNELGQTQAAFGMAVYVALCRLSSREKNSPEVRATIGKIAGMARVGYRTAFDILKALETIARVIKITAGERAPGHTVQPPNTYTLLACRLHKAQSARLPIAQSADCGGRSPSPAENPKDSAFGREDKKKEGNSGSALDAQPLPSFSKEGPFGDVGDWRRP
jgi:hypothetical protein